MQELLYTCLYLGVLAGLFVPLVAIVLYYRAPRPRALELAPAAHAEAAPDAEAVPGPEATPGAEAALDDEPVLVTFVADTPWGNAGETLSGTLTRMVDGQHALCVEVQAGIRHTIAHGEPYVRVQELRAPDTSQ